MIKTGLALVGLGTIGYFCWQGYNYLPQLVNKPERDYELLQEEDQFYLIDSISGEKKVITKDFELGTSEERLEGLLYDGKEGLDKLLQKGKKHLKKHLGDEKEQPQSGMD